MIDVGLPGADGLTLVRRLRSAGKTLPTLILTARCTLNDKVNALDLGADDFLSWVVLCAERPVTAVAETIAAMRRLFEGERHHPDGRFVTGWTNAAYLRFPITHRIPIYVGAMSPRMLELIGSTADGGLPLLFPPEHFAAHRRHRRPRRPDPAS